MNTVLFLVARVLHVFVAASWIGATLFTSFLLVPAAEEAGASGGHVMRQVDRRGFHAYMGVLAMTTVVTGAYLLWRFTGGFDAEVAATHAGVAFCVGGTAGILALIIGASVVGRNARTAVEVMGRATAMADGVEKQALVGRAAAARGRAKAGSRAVVALQALALVSMTIAHYV